MTFYRFHNRLKWFGLGMFVVFLIALAGCSAVGQEQTTAPSGDYPNAELLVTTAWLDQNLGTTACASSICAPHRITPGAISRARSTCR